MNPGIQYDAVVGRNAQHITHRHRAHHRPQLDFDDSIFPGRTREVVKREDLVLQGDEPEGGIGALEFSIIVMVDGKIVDRLDQTLNEILKS